MAYFETTSHGLWFRNFISGLGVVDSVARPLKIYCDNVATVFFAKNDKYPHGAKRIDVKYLVIKQEIWECKVLIEQISSNFMIADPLTKGLPPKTFNEHVERMGVVERHYW